MNGTPIGGSPFPVFFSPPQPGAPPTDVGGSGPTVDGVPIAGPLGSQVANLTDGLTVRSAQIFLFPSNEMLRFCKTRALLLRINIVSALQDLFSGSVQWAIS